MTEVVRKSTHGASRMVQQQISALPLGKNGNASEGSDAITADTQLKARDVGRSTRRRSGKVGLQRHPRSGHDSGLQILLGRLDARAPDLERIPTGGALGGNVEFLVGGGRKWLRSGQQALLHFR